MSMLLGIAASTGQVGVAFGGTDGPVASLQVRQGRRHGELLAPAIETLGRMSGIGMSKITRVAVDIGPGLFTGLRVGVATAKAFASALELPIVGCSSLEILAYPHRRSGQAVASVIDARRGEVFWALHEPSEDESGMRMVTDPEVLAPKALAAALAQVDRRVLAVGDGASRYADVLGQVEGVELAGASYDHPSAAVLVELAATRASVPLEEITPLYLRGADVRIKWQERTPEVASRG